MRHSILILSLVCAISGCRTDKSPFEEEDVPDSWDRDEDGDGFTADEDCNDNNGAIYPSADELCDDIDNDCDGEVDEDLRITLYSDSDGDGFGNPNASESACEINEGWVENDTDCNDSDAAVYPNADERCDEIDNDCDGEIDEDVRIQWYADADGDGYGDPDILLEECNPPNGYVSDNTDCNDSTPTAYPSAEEVCDEIDNNCDGTVDEGVTTTWYADYDNDGWGISDTSTEACTQPSGYALLSGDCNDGDPNVSPSETEICNGVDDDCDGDIDLDAIDPSIWYADSDGDGYGDVDSSVNSCDAPSGHVADNTDCNDGDSTVHPAADELCNGVDDDCDDLIDDDDPSLTDATTWYIDYDSDGYGSSSYTTDACDAPSGFVASDDDCDDTDGSVYPSATELYDSQDNDCDGDTDEDMWTGTGADGSLTVTADTDLSIDSSGTRSEPDAVIYGLEEIDESTLTLDANADGIETGDEVMIINLQGSSTRNDAVGTHEFASVVSVSGDEIELADSLSHVFGEDDNSDLSGQIIVVQRVPHYTDVTVYAGGTLTTSAWDGESGSVLAFRATGTVWVEDGGSISVSALGYAGGDTGPNDNEDGYQGESLGGEGLGGASSATSPAYNESIAGYLSNFGGGGSNVTGGGGEYGGGATGGDAWYPGLYTAPDAGIEYGEAELDQLFMGSGGGGVWNGGSDDVGEDPGPGGHGGGIVYFGAHTVLLDGATTVTAEGGSTDHWASGTFTYGAGGGAGGSIFILSDTIELVSNAILADGGLGQSSYIRAGGDGGDGRIRIDCNTCGGYAQGSSEAETALQSGCSPAPGHSTVPE